LAPLDPAADELPPVKLAAAALLSARSTGLIATSVEDVYGPAVHVISSAASATVARSWGATQPAEVAAVLPEMAERLVPLIAGECVRLLGGSAWLASALLTRLVEVEGADPTAVVRAMVDAHEKQMEQFGG
jgi:hypothetical protein